ncbi:M81 family peptidase [Siculibacillus lacustris]|uniref:Microcystinase C n=1 Tax=Siculibacillus lacustris TaxID=1549641 RepID=A0A4Q9VMK7_9HYPH|nr:M81 family metallopeptidase [Siculibacillus lacustris]TBW36806.1 M81 family peptidase [Siculibacillus lacustris]
MPFKVLTAEFLHESNTFSIRPTGLRQFEVDCLLYGEAAIAARRSANTGLAGALDVAERFGWNLVHVLSAHAEPAGPVTREAFERIAGEIVAAAEREKPDGLLLILHGAMVCADFDDGEGELLARLRAVLAPGVPIAATLDLHANVTDAMIDHAEIWVSYKTYPHVDMRIAAVHAGEILQRTLTGEIRPTTLKVRRPMLEEANGGRTDTGAMIERLARARAWEARPDAFAVSINGGFADADIAEVGPTVLVTHDGDPAPHRAFAEELADDIWARRHDVINRFLTVEEAADRARRFVRHTGPLIVADYADNPGGGAYGDGTELLAALLAVGLENACFGPMVDPETAALLHTRQPGERVAIALGGKTDPRFGGRPLELEVELVSLHDGRLIGNGPMLGGLAMSYGPTAVVAVGGMRILVVSEPMQMRDLAQFQTFGIDPAAATVVGLKSMQHFRAAFAPIAEEIIVCDSGALCTMAYERLPFAKARRPIWPLDRDFAL